MIIDRSVYPDIDPPDVLSSPEERADYLHRICAAFDFGVFPEEADWTTFAGWRDVFDRFPLRIPRDITPSATGMAGPP